MFGTIFGGLTLLRSKVSGKRENVFLAGKLQAGDQLTCYQKHFETDVNVYAVNSGDVFGQAVSGGEEHAGRGMLGSRAGQCEAVVRWRRRPFHMWLLTCGGGREAGVWDVL